MSLYGLIMAGHNVEWMVSRHIQKQHPEMADGNMTRTEFHLIDNFRIISFLFLLQSIVLCCIGGKTLRAVSKSNSSFANLVFKKNLYRLAFIFVTSLVIHKFMKDTHNIFEEHMQKFNEAPREVTQYKWRREQPKPKFHIMEDEQVELMEPIQEPYMP